MPRTVQTDLMPDFTGRSLDGGRYRLLALLGAGAYGKVYRAIDLQCKSSPPILYAIKVMNKHPAGSHDALLQEREFANHTTVTGHSNVVGFHRHWEDGLYVYVVLDLCSGGDLFGAITDKRFFKHNSQLIKSLFIQLCCAVEHCHKLGVYHRDIKPENVLLSEDRTVVRLADLGLSTINELSTDWGCGSSYYLSPECIGRQSAFNLEEIPYSTVENDVWALGIILANMVTGRNPWRYAASSDDCYVAFTRDRNFLKRVLPISEGFNTILKKVFTVQPSRRISLAALKEEVLRLDSFFEDGKELPVKLESPIPTPNSSRPILHSHDSDIINTNVNLSPDFEDDCIIIEVKQVSRRPSGILYPPTSKAITKNFTLVGSNDTGSATSTSSSSLSSESEGPITPETHPVVDDPAVDIPDISGEGLGPTADFVSLQPLVIKDRAASPQKSRRAVDILRSAVQRIKLLSKGSREASS